MRAPRWFGGAPVLPAAVPLTLVLLAAAPAAIAADCTLLTDPARVAACVGDDYANADATLNRSYQSVMRALDPEGKALLRDAERAWIGFRDKHCAFVGAASGGGSIEATVIGQCETELTIDRIAQLAWQLTCDPTDAACAR